MRILLIEDDPAAAVYVSRVCPRMVMFAMCLPKVRMVCLPRRGKAMTCSWWTG